MPEHNTSSELAIKVVFTDIDGVWTDGSMYYDQTGNELKRFHTYDSAGVLLLRMLDIPVVVLTREKTEIVTRRCAKLRMEHVHQGVLDKLTAAREICAGMGYTLDQAAYIGDDVPDLQLLAAVAYSGAPANAPDYVKKAVMHVMNKRGGEGAFREFVEGMLGPERMEGLVAQWRDGQ